MSMTLSQPTRRLRIYCAGPMTSGDRMTNVNKATMLGHRLVQLGYSPLIPHLTHYIDPTDALGYDTWIDVDLAWVEVSDVVFRMRGSSNGADIEVAYAQERGIPVVYSIAELEEKFESRVI